MRVLVIPTWYPSPEDPVSGIFIRDHARAVARDHDVIVLAPYSASADPDTLEESVRTLRLAPPVGSGRIATLGRLRALNAFVGRLADEGWRPEVLHAHTFSSGALAAVLGRRWRVPLVVSEHDSDLVEGLVSGWDARVARFAYRSAAIVCPVSEVLRRSIVELEPRARCEVVGEVVDVDTFAGARRSKSAGRSQRILAVAGLARQKGLTHLIEAFRLLAARRANITLEIVGDGPERVALEAQATGLSVVFRGSLARHEVRETMSRSDVLAVPSVVETFGIVPLESLAAGLPVVITDVAGVAALVATYGGSTVPPADAVAFSRALEEVLDRPEPRVRADTVDELRRRFSPGAIADSFHVIYRSLLG